MANLTLASHYPYLSFLRSIRLSKEEKSMRTITFIQLLRILMKDAAVLGQFQAAFGKLQTAVGYAAKLQAISDIELTLLPIAQDLDALTPLTARLSAGEAERQGVEIEGEYNRAGLIDVFKQLLALYQQFKPIIDAILAILGGLAGSGPTPATETAHAKKGKDAEDEEEAPHKKADHGHGGHAHKK
jgi:hypothetical protein